MRRTSIYLAEEQSAALEDLARARRISRAELIRQFIDRSITTSGAADLEADLAAIRESFGVLGDDAITTGRGLNVRHYPMVEGLKPPFRLLHMERAP